MPLPLLCIAKPTVVNAGNLLVLPNRSKLLKLLLGISSTWNQVCEASFEVFQSLLRGRAVLLWLKEPSVQSSL